MVDDHPTPLDDGAAFFGAITASVSHELNNVIAIVDQTGGLLQDMIAARERGTAIDADRLARAAESVRQQAARGLGIIRRLNRFAHSADEPSCAFDASEVIENLAGLCQRFAELKRVRLEFRPAPDAGKVVGSPFLLQAAVFQALRLALAAAQRDDTATVSIVPRDGDTIVRVECPRRIEAEGDDATVLHRFAGYAGGRVAVNHRAEGTVVDIVLSTTR